MDRLDAECAARTRLRGIGSLSIRIARRGQLLYRCEPGTAAEQAVRYRIGSLTKPVVACAVLRLVAGRRLRLDDAIARHLPALAGRGDLRAVTLAHLLAHTAGLARGPYALVAPADHHVLAHIAAAPLACTPGARFKYSNWGYFLLGKAIESATGETLEAHLGRTLFAPLGMNGSGFAGLEPGAAGPLAPGHWQGWHFGCPDLDADRTPSPCQPMAAAAGGMLASADDLLRWLCALAGAGRGADPLLAHAARAMLVAQRRLGPTRAICHGWLMDDAGGAPLFYFSGSTSGHSGFMFLAPDSGTVGVALCDQGACANELRAILHALCRGLPALPVLPALGGRGAPIDLVASRRRDTLRLCGVAGGEAQLRRGGHVVRLQPHSGAAWFVRDGGGGRHMLRARALGSGEAVLTLGDEVYYEDLRRLRRSPAQSQAWDALAGLYVNDAFGRVEVLVREGRPLLNYGAAYEASLEPVGDLAFRQGPGAFCFEPVVFQRDSGSGRVPSFELNGMPFRREEPA